MAEKIYFMGGTGSQMTEEEIKRMKESWKKLMGADYTEKEFAEMMGKKSKGYGKVHK